MKKILILFISTVIVASVYGQSGSGTSGDPYYGTISGAVVWDPGNFTNGEVYVGSATLGEDLTIDGGHLTILPGIKVIFMTTGSDLIITNMGQLTADGTPASQITFTRYYPTYSHWGHISFQTTSGTSLLDNCIVEYGDVSSFANTDPNGVGGGIFLGTSSVTVSSCTVQHNRAQWGGGLFVYPDMSPAISNCYFYDNFALEAGGGAYLYDRSGPVVSDCIFYSNSCQGTSLPIYTGGGLALQSNSSAKIINCTFANNTSSRTEGQGIMVYSSASSQVINSIFWGSDKEIYCENTAASVIINCAYQGITYTSGSPVNPIILNSSNNASDGPNFASTDGSNWAIQFISPCRDAGTTPSPAIPYDIIGNPRLGPYDIGAYEVQYNRWTGAINTDWFTSGNWSSNVPTAHTSPVIGPSAHDPVITLQSPSLNSLLIESSSALTVADGQTLSTTNVQNSGTLTVTAGATLSVSSFINGGTFILQPTGMATVTSLTNNGTINLNSNFSAMFSMILGSYSGTGTVNTQVYFTGGINNGGYSWHYTAVPQTVSKTYLTSLIVDQANVNLLLYDDSKITSAPTPHAIEQGWQWHDGYLGTTAFSTLYEKRGYNFYRKTTDASVATYPATSLLSDLGSVDLQYSGSSNNDNLYGWNLLGNSLTCGLNWDNVATSGRNAIYITKDNAQASYVAGVGVNGGSNFIPPLQGFFIQATDIGQSVDFSAPGVKVHTDQSYFKKSLEAGSPKGSTGTIPLVRLEIHQGVLKDETVIRIDNNATLQFDNTLDASKWLSTSEIPQLYSYFSADMYSIDAIPFPSPLTNIPLAVVIPSDGTYSLNRTLIVGIDNYNVILKDIQQNITVNLRDVDTYTFTSVQGTFKDRFVLTIDNSTTGVNDIIKPEKEFNLYHFGGMLNIMPLSDDWNGKQSLLNVYDMTGRVITNKPNIEWNKGTLQQIWFEQPNGIYIVEIKGENKRFVGKINIIR